MDLSTAKSYRATPDINEESRCAGDVPKEPEPTGQNATRNVTVADPDTQIISDDASRRRRFLEFALFAIVALSFMFAIGPTMTGLSFENRDLLDTDGYMRYLRVEEMLDGGQWFDPLSTRSNYPHGETQHWTRIVDLYVAGLALLLMPFLGTGALYGAAVVNGPLLFVAIGAAAYWAFSSYIPRSLRAIAMPLLLVFWPVVFYSFPGRVDHHAPIMLAFVVTLGWVIRFVTSPSRRSAIFLGMSLALGVWLSVEFLVAVGLTALAVGVRSVTGPPGTARGGSTAFLTAGVAQAIFVLVERGPAWSTIELDRISTVHVGLALIIGVIFGVYARLPTSLATWQRWGLLSLLSGIGLGMLLIWHPPLARGPFGDVDPIVQEIWLFHVSELRPLFDRGLRVSLIPFVLPVLIGIVAGGFQIRRGKPHSMLVFAWLSVYTILMIAQIRWTPFAQLLSLPLVVTALASPYERLGSLKAAPILRPLVLSVVIVGVPMFAPLLAASGTTPAFDCRVGDAVQLITGRPRTTVLAMQDLGSETLYRSDHNVIATPYHRNEEGILFVRQVMSLTDSREVRAELARRDVGLILICPERNDLTRPAEPAGTFYQWLVEGPLPEFVTAVPRELETDWLLFEVGS